MTDRVRLTLRGSIPGRLGADAIAPDRLAALSASEIAALPLWPTRSEPKPVGASRPRRAIPLGEVFSVEGGRAASVEVRGDLHTVDGLGTQMAGGSLVIEGDVGRETGREMRGGTLVVHGSVAEHAGRGMAGGVMRIMGDAGDGLGNPLAGAAVGMTGGEIVIDGRAGRGAATGVRRGLVVVAGDAGEGAGEGMIAGTLVVMGRIAGVVGQWNKRGSIIAVGGAAIPLTYRAACIYRPLYLRVLFTYLRSREVRVEERVVAGQYARYCGDMSQLGKGELLVGVA